MDPAVLPTGMQNRAERLMGLLELLEHLPAPECCDKLVMRTMKCIESGTTQGHEHDVAAAAASAAGNGQGVTVHLCEADAAAVDALVESGFDLAAVPAGEQARGRKVLALLGTLDHLEAPSTGDLLAARTMQSIQRHIEQQRLGQQIDRLSSMPGSGLSLRELVAVAAMFLIAVSLMWPLLGSARSAARQAACSANMGFTGQVMSTYAADYNSAMPAAAVHLGDPWWLTNKFNTDGTALSNSAHLFLLARTDRIRIDVLSCPENADRTVKLDPTARDWAEARCSSFSYQNQYTNLKPRLNGGPNIALLADKNPFFQPGKYRMDLRYQRPQALSENHASRGGQNVLMTSGEVEFMTKPVVSSDDNIFHAGTDGQDNYTGREGPADINDSFLVP